MLEAHTENNTGINKAKAQEVFLATTSLEDFWDTSERILFLGNWCRRYSRKTYWESLNAEVIPALWDTQEKIIEAYKNINDAYERLLSLLGESLNEIHGLNYSKRYWRILIGQWLYYYVSVVFEKYSYVKEVLRIYPEFTTIGLSEDCFVTACDTTGFIQYLKEDLYHLQIYTCILKALGKDFPRKKEKIISRPFGAPVKTTPFGVIFRRLLRNILLKIELIFKNGKPIILKNSYFHRYAELKLILLTFGKVWTCDIELIELKPKPTNFAARAKIKDLAIGNSEFEKVLMGMLAHDIPQCFIESFKTVKEYAVNSYPKKTRAIFSAIAWYADEAFKQWAGACAENGALLLASQHGGSYGSIALFHTEEHEIKIADRFYSWGWEAQGQGQKFFSMPVPMLLLRKPIGANNRKQGILLGAGWLPRIFFIFPYLPQYFEDYLKWQSRFIKTVSVELRIVMRVRLHREDSGWDMNKRLKDVSPELFIENWDIPFINSLENCRLYVCDNLQTTFIEALAANKPTVLFWNPKINPLRPEAEPYYNLLRDAGILFDNPEDAARTVNSVYNDVEVWWNDPRRQDARKKFCDRFGRNSTNGIKDWAKEFIRMAKNGSITT